MNDTISIISLSIVLGLACSESKGINPQDELIQGAQTGSLVLIHRALARGAQLGQDDTFGRAVHICTENGRIECLRTLFLAEAHILIDGPNFKFIAPQEAQVDFSRRKLAATLLSIRYAGSGDGPKVPNPAGEWIVSSACLRSQILLADSGLRDDVFTVFLSLLVKGRKVGDTLFRLVQYELGDYLLIKLKNALRKINDLPKINGLPYILSLTRNVPAYLAREIYSLCNPELVEENFEQVIRRAVQERFNEILRIERDLIEGAYQGSLTLLESALARGAWIGAKSHGQTALHHAASEGHLACLRVLLENGAQIETNDYDNKTALHCAAQRGHTECLRALLLAKAHLVVRGTDYRIIAPLSEDKVVLSKRRLKAALLGLRFAGSAADGTKVKNSSGDSIASSDYVRSWFLLSHGGLREDVFNVFLSSLAMGKKVDYALFRLAQEGLRDFLIARLKATLREIRFSRPIGEVVSNLPATQQVEICNLCDPDLVEENFSDLIMKCIKERFNELLKATNSQVSAAAPQNSSSSSSTSPATEERIKMRI